MPVRRSEHGAPLDRGRNRDIRVEVRSLNFYDSLLEPVLKPEACVQNVKVVNLRT